MSKGRFCFCQAKFPVPQAHLRIVETTLLTQDGAEDAVDHEHTLTWWPMLGILFTDHYSIAHFDGMLHDPAAIESFAKTKGGVGLVDMGE